MRSDRPRPIGRTIGALLASVLLAAPAGRARAGDDYAIDQRFGDISFTINHLGLFSSHGQFRAFTGTLTIDEAHPANTRVTVTIATGSVEMAWPEAVAMLRSPAYFDVTRYQQAVFTSTRVSGDGPDRYTVDGTLELRGVRQPVELEALLVGRHKAPEAGEEIADFVVTGKLRRSAFGMVSDRTFISDTVNLRIHARVRLDAAAHAD